MLLNYGIGENSWESLGLQRRSNQSILTEISPEYSLEGLMLKLKLQYFGNLKWRTNSLEKTLMLGKFEGRRKGGWRGMTEVEMVECHHWLNGQESEQALGFGDGQGSLACYSPWGHKETDMTEQLTALNWCCSNPCCTRVPCTCVWVDFCKRFLLL